MFIGHFGVALAARPVAARLNLGALFVATQWLDIVCCLFLITGLEVVRIHPGRSGTHAVEVVSAPWSHGVAAVLVWSALGAVAVLLALREAGSGPWRAAATVAALIGAHGVFDLVRLSDVPPFAALGEWPGVVLETILLLAGLVVYLRATRPRDRLGRWGVPLLAALLVALNAYVGASAPPASVSAMAATNLATYGLIAVLAWRLDAHRDLRGTMVSRTPTRTEAPWTARRR